MLADEARDRAGIHVVGTARAVADLHEDVPALVERGDVLRICDRCETAEREKARESQLLGKHFRCSTNQFAAGPREGDPCGSAKSTKTRLRSHNVPINELDIALPEIKGRRLV